MASGSFVPDIVIGIDFGMTCTGVAYSMAPEWAAPRTIQHWPGKLGYENRNKVDTAVAYDHDNGELKKWGFLVDNDGDDDLDIQELFKLYLDASYHREYQDDFPIEEVHMWFVDYMRCLHSAIEEHFAESIARWGNRKVEFLFSVPTTWRNPAMIAQIDKLIKQAGFTAHQNHYVRITLTEAEAAAVCVAKETGYQRGDVFLVCDSGGGTTDVNILKIQSSYSGRTQLEQLSCVEGESVGSALIDFNMEKLVKNRLNMIQDRLDHDVDRTLKHMLNDRFEIFKCSFGAKAQTTLDLYLPVPGMAPGLDFPDASVKDSKMVITSQELRQVFDEQVDRIIRLLDQEIKTLRDKVPNEKISYLVLSGGLGSSPYLKQRLRKRYELGENSDMYNARNIKILTATEPQLVVCRGLVMDRTQEIESTSTSYAERCCRNSYGIIVRQLYDPKKHQGENVIVDRRDKKKWAERQIHWFIRQGETVSVKEGIKNHYRLKLDLEQEKLPWKTQIVMSSLPPNELPKSMKHEGAKRICQVEATLNEKHLKRKNWHWYNFGPQYHRAEFDIRIIIGSADMKFEILAGGQVVSSEHEDIEVAWEAPEKREASDDKVVVQDVFGIYQEMV